MGDAGAGEGDDVVGARGRIGLHDDDRLHLFAPRLAGHTDDGDVGDGGMAEHRALDVGRIDVLAAGDDHVLHAVVNVDIAVLVQIAGVTGAQPAAGVERR